MSEHDGRDVFVIEVTFRLASEQTIGQPAPGGDRHRRELLATGHVADGIEASAGRGLELVGHDESIVIQTNTRLLEPELLDLRDAPDRPDDGVEGRQPPAVAYFQIE